MRVTSKGQITIPQSVRECARLAPGTEVEVVATQGGALVRPLARRSHGEAVVAALRDSADAGLDADEVLRLTRGDE